MYVSPKKRKRSAETSFTDRLSNAGVDMTIAEIFCVVVSAPAFYFTDTNSNKNIPILRVAIGAKDTHTAQTTAKWSFVSVQVPCFFALFFCASVGLPRRVFSLGHAFLCSECGLETERSKIMTLKELQNKIETTVGKALPTAAWLRAGNAPLAISREITKSGKLSVYVNGFALYETECGITVFRVDYCGGYTYFGADTEDTLSEEFFADADWWVRLVMEGEDRLTHNRKVRIENYESFYGYDDTAISSLCTESMQEEYLQHELVELAFSIMTERQREVAQLYYIDGYGIKEIAKLYGISFQAVSVTLADIRKKFQKNRKYFE